MGERREREGESTPLSLTLFLFWLIVLWMFFCCYFASLLVYHNDCICIYCTLYPVSSYSLYVYIVSSQPKHAAL